MHVALRPDLDQRNGEAAGLNEDRRIAGYPSVALDRAGMTVFPHITFLAAGLTSERSRQAKLKGF
jgi:hypothetical protein